MRGMDQQRGALSIGVSLEDRVPADHPLRVVRVLVDRALAELAPRFEAMYALVGDPSVPSDQLLRALLLQGLYTVRSERHLMEQLDYNLLFRWFVELRVDEPVWLPTAFMKNRDQLLAGDVARAFFAAVVGEARQRSLLADEHFRVDSTLLEAWVSAKSLPLMEPAGAPPGDSGDPAVGSRGERGSSAPNTSTTDLDPWVARKGNRKDTRIC
jgi:transposase